MDYILLAETKPAGTDGGDFLSGQWRIRQLNAILSDAGNNCTLANNRFTLQPGTYRIRATCPAYRTQQHKAGLWDHNGGQMGFWVSGVVGTAKYAEQSYNAMNDSLVVGRFTTTEARTFELRHRCAGNVTGQGMGVAAGFGLEEVYATVELWKE